MSSKITVYNPTGYPPMITGKELAPSLPSLDGKTVCLVDGKFDETCLPFFEQMQGWFADHMPKVKTEIVRWREPFADDPDASAIIAEHGDAAILGVGV